MERYCGLGLGLVATLLALALTAVSLGTDYWLEMKVDRSSMTQATRAKGEPWYFSRHRGLFRTCVYTNEDTAWLDSHPDKTDTNCLREKGYEFTGDIGIDNFYYGQRKHLMRTHVFSFGFALLFLLMCFVGGSFGCLYRLMSANMFASVMSFLSALLILLGMACFHGYVYLEKNKINLSGFYYVYKNLGLTMSMSYSWSYIVGWVALGMAALAAVSFSFTTCILGREKNRRNLYPEEKIYSNRTSSRPGVYHTGPPPGVVAYPPPSGPVMGSYPASPTYNTADSGIYQQHYSYQQKSLIPYFEDE